MSKERPSNSTFSGFAALREPTDLVDKLVHDIDRMNRDPGNEYAAFDFFVTAEHVIDWLYPDDKQKRVAMRNGDPLLQLVSHLANGAKHFEVRDTRHNSVMAVHKAAYTDGSCEQSGVEEEELIVSLSPSQAKAFGIEQFDAITLAYRVLAYWQRHFG